MSAAQVFEYLNDVTWPAFPNLDMRYGNDSESCWLQIVDTTLPVEFNSGRKWRVSYHACRGEVVQTALTALLAWFEHEVREGFLWKGRAIFQPHSDLGALWEAAGKSEYRD